VDENEIGEKILGCALTVHKALGPGLLESVYETCLLHELRKAGLDVRKQVPLRVVYDEIEIEAAYRLDLLIAGLVVIEVKALEQIAPVHRAQLLSYLKLGRYKLGYLLNFNVPLMRDGIHRLVNGL
jgi:GxxExxY protein